MLGNSPTSVFKPCPSWGHLQSHEGSQFWIVKRKNFKGCTEWVMVRTYPLTSMKHWDINKEDSTYARLNEIYGLLYNLPVPHISQPQVTLLHLGSSRLVRGGMKCRLEVYSKVYSITGFEFWLLAQGTVYILNYNWGFVIGNQWLRKKTSTSWVTDL